MTEHDRLVSALGQLGVDCPAYDDGERLIVDLQNKGSTNPPAKPTKVDYIIAGVALSAVAVFGLVLLAVAAMGLLGI